MRSATSLSNTSPRGLCGEEVAASRKAHGANILSKRRRKSFFRRFVSNLGDPVIRILLGALAINLVFLAFRNADWIETAGIGFAVLLATLISTFSEYNSDKAFDRLSDASGAGFFRVRRDGAIREIPISEIVVGDSVLLSAGEQIPADGLLVSGRLRADQSAMTGESREIEKYPTAHADRDPASPAPLFRGCTVTAGDGEMTVTAVGDGTFLGGISREVQEERRDSPLKRRLTKLAGQISKLGYVAAVLVALAYLFNVFFMDSGMRRELLLYKLSDPVYVFSQLLHALTLGLTVLVVAVPEGLPMMIAVVLSANIKRMMRDQVLVRKPVGIEAAGSMNLLFTDKTGTLTEGKMKVTAFLWGNGAVSSPPAEFRRNGDAANLLGTAFRYGVEAVAGKDASGRPCALGGSATERALLECAVNAPLPEPCQVLSRLPFDSTRKFSAVTVRGKDTKTFLIGAPERILPFVTDFLLPDGGYAPFSASAAERAIRKQTETGGRVLAVALAAGGTPAQKFDGGVYGDLTLVCLPCLADPLRAEARDSVTKLHGAGIGVVMITGDNRDTARAIAAGAGLLTRERDLVLSRDELAALPDLRLAELLPRLAVVARALPTDKSRLVRVAQESGLVVGMTGDGINDAPALRRADVGFAMGSGTQVAKDAGDVIILDNNLASIVRAVLYGRTVFKSIRKFITLQLTMNFYAVGVTMICPFLGIEAPVTVVQMLWINLIMDTLGGLAFAGEAPLPDFMKEPPKKRDEPILNRYMANEILFHGGFTICLFLLFLKHPFFTSRFRPSPDRLYLLTAFFALFIFASVFNCFNARTDRLNLTAGLGKNPVFLGIMGAILVIQIAFIYLGGSILRTAPLLPRELLLTMFLSLSVFPAELLRKLLWRLRGKRTGY